MVNPAVIIAWVAIALAAVFVVLATQQFQRTKGREWKFHLAYAIVVAVLVLLLPADVKQYVFSTPGIVVAGSIYPVYESLRAICSPSTADDMEWLQYWVAQGGVYFITAYIKDYQVASESVQLAWFQFEFFFYIWLYLPFTDGATLIFDFITRPFLSPVIDPITKKMTGWIGIVTTTVINGTHLWALWAFFIILPKGLKRFVTVAVGTIYPLFSSTTAISTPDKTDDTYWLTYWSCYSILFLLMDWLETYLGVIWGFYTVVIFSTVYLMLPMFQGSEKIFRNVLVPLAGLKESLLLRDAVLLKKDLMDSLPPDRQAELRKLITYSFDIETPDDEDEPGAGDSRVPVTAENAKAFLTWSTSPWSQKLKGRFKNQSTEGEGDGGYGANENTPLV